MPIPTMTSLAGGFATTQAWLLAPCAAHVAPPLGWRLPARFKAPLAFTELAQHVAELEAEVEDADKR